jgi:hypothetical protein
MGVRVGVRQRRWTGRRVALAVGVPVVVLLGLSQAFLPRLAAERVRDQIKPYGLLENVSVKAFPAIELLWGKAESASATAKRLSLSQAEAVKLVWEGRGVHESTLKVAALKLSVPGLPDGVVLHDAVLSKRGDRLSTQARITQADLDAASPSGVRVRLLPSDPGTAKVVASGSLFGVQATVEAVAMPSEGKLIAQPLNIPFGAFVRMTLFSDPHLHLEGISVTPEGEVPQEAWRLGLSGRLR